MGRFADKPPDRFLDVVQGWEGFLSKDAKNALSAHDKLALVARLEARLDEVIRPLVELAKVDDPLAEPEEEDLDAYHGAVVNALNEAARCKR